MPIRKNSILILLGLGLLWGCSKPEVVIPPHQPQGYQELLSIYDAGIPFVEVKYTSSVTLVRFEGREVSIPNGGMKIHDHSVTPAPGISISTANGMWLIDGLLSGVKHYPTLSNEQCCPVYIWFDKETLHMVIANGHRLHYPYVEKGPSEPRTFTVPVLRIRTEFSAPVVSKDEYLNATYTLEDKDGTYGPKSLSGNLQIRGRGNSTWGNPKKPYKLKLEEKTELLGMPGNKDWALMANYSDKSLLRNRTAMKLSEICGMSWTPKMVSVEVYLNSEYLGVYDLCEHKEVAKNKVNIDIVKDTDNSGEAVTGGYYFEMEQNVDEPVCWWTWKGVPMMFISPQYPTSEQQEYVKDYFYRFEQALFGNEFSSATKGYANYIDVDSFVNYFIIQELSKNVDGNLRKSTFMTKERGGKLEMYHVWDFDLAFGNADYFDGGVGNGPNNWWIKSYGCQGYHTGWYWRLFQDSGFVTKVKLRWKELKPQLDLVPEYIDFWAAELQDAPTRNFNKWKILNQYVWPNVKVPGSYKGEVEYLKEFYTQRLNWINENIDKL